MESKKCSSENPNNLEKIEEDKLTLFPNPFSNSVTLNLDHADDFNISITNMIGQVVYNESIVNSQSAEIDLSVLKKGMYCLQLYNENNIFSRKILKE